MFDTKTKKALLIMLVGMLLAWPVAWAASNLYNVLYGPAEYYQTPSIFFRTTTNPAQIIPVMASEGYRLPVDASIVITVGSISYNVSLPFKSALKTETQSLVDVNDVMYVNIASDTIGLLLRISSTTASVASLSAQQASEVISILAAQASTTLEAAHTASEVIDLAAQQATESIDLLAAMASDSLAVASNSIEALAAQATTTLRVEEQSAQQATESINLLAAMASDSLSVASNTLTTSAAIASATLEAAHIASEVIDLAAQLATETDDIVAAVASTAAETNVNLATDSVGLVLAINRVATDVIALAAQQATETASLTAVIASITDAINASPSFKQAIFITASSTNITLTPNVSYTLPTFPNLRFTSIANNSDLGEFWCIQKSGTAAINYGRRVYLNVSINNENPEPVSIISSTALAITFDQKGH